MRWDVGAALRNGLVRVELEAEGVAGEQLEPLGASGFEAQPASGWGAGFGVLISAISSPVRVRFAWVPVPQRPAPRAASSAAVTCCHRALLFIIMYVYQT